MEEPGFSEEVFEKNRVRELVTAFFRHRDCCALMRPAEEETELNALQTAATAGVRPGFIRQVRMHLSLPFNPAYILLDCSFVRLML